jgi:magnesium transporter
MITKYNYKDLVWVDVESPTNEELRGLMEEYNVDALVAEELLLPTLKPKVDLYKDYIYLILHFPAIKHTFSTSPNQEVDFIIGKKFIITTRYDTIDPLHKFSKVFEVNSVIDKSDIGDHAGMIFFYMIRKLYKALMHELEHIRSEMSSTEDKMFKGREVEVVQDLSEINRQLLNFQKATSFHKEVLASFEVAGKKFFGEDFSYHLHSISGEFFRIHNAIEAEREYLKELRETNNSLVSTKQNEVMKFLTIMAFITFPLSLIAAIFGMNTEYLPIVGLENDFWIVMGIIGVAVIGMIGFFKYKKWM